MKTMAVFFVMGSIGASEFLSWYGAGYLGAFILGLLFLVLALMGMGEHEVNHDISHDVSHDTHIGHDAHGHDGHGDTQGHHILTSILSVLGIGRCPLSIVLMTYLFLFSLIGVASLTFLKPITFTSVIFGTVSYAIAGVGAFFLTGIIARLISKIMPTGGTSIKKTAAIVGMLAKAKITFANGKGIIQTYDANSSLIEKMAETVDPTQSVKYGQEVIIVSYDDDRDVVKVQLAPNELAALPRQ